MQLILFKINGTIDSIKKTADPLISYTTLYEFSSQILVLFDPDVRIKLSLLKYTKSE